MTKKQSDNKKVKQKLNFNDKRIILLTLISILVLVLLITTSLAAFISNANSDDKDMYASGDLIVDFDDSTGNAINLNPAQPVTDEYGSSLDPYTFTIENTGTLTATYKIYLTDEVISNPNGLTNDQVKTNIKYQINDYPPELLSTLNGNLIISGGINPGQVLSFDLRLWIKEEAPNEMENTTYGAKIAVTGQAVREYIDPSGANKPELASGMIPVVYDETNSVWEVADKTTAWYSYADQKWANAVTVTSESRNEYLGATPGTEISMEDINSMWVWIPRYKYRIANSIGIGTSTSPITNPPQIDVIFESGTNATGVEESVYRNGITNTGLNTNYYTHPIFRDGSTVYNSEAYDIGGWDKELPGIWVGKFETGGTYEKPIIKPNVTALGGLFLIDQFASSLKYVGGTIDGTTSQVTFTENSNNEYGLNTTKNTIDTHLMKNTEWGAVAYLSHSKYGKMGNDLYTGENKQIYVNISDSYITGNSNGIPSDDTINTQCAYNDIADRGNGTGACGAGASTTGTIYGIYDMHGGTAEYTMGNWNNISSLSGFSLFPDSKYYDKYTGTVSSTFMPKAQAILGDATWETIFWYSSASYTQNTSDGYHWTFRSSAYGWSPVVGEYSIFNSDTMDGQGDITASFRTVLIP